MKYKVFESQNERGQNIIITAYIFDDECLLSFSHLNSPVDWVNLVDRKWAYGSVYAEIDSFAAENQCEINHIKSGTWN